MRRFLRRAVLAWKRHRKFRQLYFSTFGKVLDYPEIVFFELTNSCNFECIMCPKTQLPGKEREIGFMDFELFKKGIGEVVKKNVPGIALHGFGESMLHPDFLRFVKYAKYSGVPEVFLFTNGSLLNENLSRHLIEVGLDRLAVSFEGATKETHESVDRGADYERDKRNVERLIEMREDIGSTTPIVEVNSVVIDQTKDEIGKLKEIWEDKADVVSTQTYMKYYEEEMADMLSGKEISNERKICTSPSTQLMVYWDGKVSACCGDPFGELIVGDLKEQSLSEIWDGKSIRGLREKLFNKDYQGLMCEHCEGSRKGQEGKSFLSILKALLGF